MSHPTKLNNITHMEQLKLYLITRVRAIEGAHIRFQGIAVGSPVLISKLEDLHSETKYSFKI